MTTMQYMKVLAGSVLLAVFAYALLAAPGFLTEEASTVPQHRLIATVQP